MLRFNDATSPVIHGDILLLFTGLCSVGAADDYVDGVLPYVQKYCVECHNEEVHKGDLDLTRFATEADVTANFRRWDNIVEFIQNGEMPPKEAKQQPEIIESNALVGAVEKILLAEAVKYAGDPVWFCLGAFQIRNMMRRFVN